MNLKPVADNIILKPVDKETKTAAGIIIPETVEKERPEQGKVIAVGPGKILDNGQRKYIEVHEGQTIMFKKYTADEFEIKGEKYLIIKSDDVIAVVE